MDLQGKKSAGIVGLPQPVEGLSSRSRNRATVDRSKRSAKAREALMAQKRMRKAKAAALKAKQMERQMQHVRRIKRLDTTIRPVLGNRTNQLPSRLDMEVKRASKPGKNKTETSVSGEDILYGDGMSYGDLGKVCEDSGAIDNSNESFESNSYTKYDEVSEKWNPMFGDILSPLQETNEEESQSLNSALSPEALKILNSARQKRSIGTIYVQFGQVQIGYILRKQ